jgi:hypothetical protein
MGHKYFCDIFRINSKMIEKTTMKRLRSPCKSPRQSIAEIIVNSPPQLCIFIAKKVGQISTIVAHFYSFCTTILPTLAFAGTIAGTSIHLHCQLLKAAIGLGLREPFWAFPFLSFLIKAGNLSLLQSFHFILHYLKILFLLTNYYHRACYPSSFQFSGRQD